MSLNVTAFDIKSSARHFIKGIMRYDSTLKLTSMSNISCKVRFVTEIDMEVLESD